MQNVINKMRNNGVLECPTGNSSGPVQLPGVTLAQQSEKKLKSNILAIGEVEKVHISACQEKVGKVVGWAVVEKGRFVPLPRVRLPATHLLGPLALPTHSLGFSFMQYARLK